LLILQRSPFISPNFISIFFHFIHFYSLLSVFELLAPLWAILFVFTKFPSPYYFCCVRDSFGVVIPDRIAVSPRHQCCHLRFWKILFTFSFLVFLIKFADFNYSIAFSNFVLCAVVIIYCCKLFLRHLGVLLFEWACFPASADFADCKIAKWGKATNPALATIPQWRTIYR